MWHHLQCVCALVLASSSLVTAAEHKFPYKALVVADQAELRCGPGTRFYVTGHAKKSQKVEVFRHDHGGWFMISPPPGSFSWVDVSAIKKVASDRGMVEVMPGERVIVRIGSQISDDHAYYGRELSNGDEVQILGEEILHMARGPVKMYKIVPPAQEFRWIKGEYLVPADQQLQQAQAADPYLVPPEHREKMIQVAQEEEKVVEQKVAEVRRERSIEFQHLDEIDRRFNKMVEKEPAAWDLDGIEHEYRALQKSSNETVGKLVDQRLAVIDKRREIYAHYQNFIQLASETSQRDAQLSAMNTGFETATSTTIVTGSAEPEFSGQTLPGPALGATTSGQTMQAPPSQFVETEDPVAPRINGAGIVQQVNSIQGPRFVLLAPDGRLLAHLVLASRLPIQEWVGKESGIIGHRAFDPAYGADVIRVKRIVPVQLVK